MNTVNLLPDNSMVTPQVAFAKHQMSLAPIKYFETKYAHENLGVQFNSKFNWNNYQVNGKIYSTIIAPLAAPSADVGYFVRPTIAIPGTIKSISKSACVLVPDDPTQLQTFHTNLHSLMIAEDGMARIKAMTMGNQNLPSGYQFSAALRDEMLGNFVEPYSSQPLDQIFVKTILDVNMLYISVRICDGVPKCIATPQMNQKKGVNLESLLGQKVQAHLRIQFRLVLDHIDKTANLRMDLTMHHIIIIDEPEMDDADDDFGFEKADDFHTEYQAVKKLKTADTPTKE
eukprot:COSAG01_NODE_3015_length_6719_cov_129.305996_5_plen_286_part_00